MLFVDQRLFKKELHALIDNVDLTGTAGWVDQFRSEVEGLAQEHKICITANEYANQLAKLLLVGYPDKAKKLVDALDDRSLSRTGFAIRTIIFLAFKLGLLAAFIIFVVFVYQKCSN